ncbi:hypothetical protein [Zunongwangia pacifica]|uniref:Peptidase S74 domain-containing protein n=1 Tax=Zunongwangia pacifica TaxID=2911062 RepID=A0A9X2CR22_9FLAO|nr:hypothetical protein [Zunongwangia pacifica]MCL6220758.1 hypothetical protein [Zunongwangia pacifica]
MNKIYVLLIIFTCVNTFSYAQWVDNGSKMTTSDVLELTKPIITFSEIEIKDKVKGSNHDKTSFFREDEISDQTYLKLQLGDETTGIFDIGYRHHIDQVWTSNFILNNGKVGIGKSNPTNKLDVNGTIHSKEVKVDREGWADFVFKDSYSLPKLEEVEKFIAENGHLEHIPTEEEVSKNGVEVGVMLKLLLQKVEELTLHVIELNNKNKELEQQLQQVKIKGQF